MTYQQRITLHTSGHGALEDLTGQVAEVVTASGIRSGLVNIFNVGSTAAVGTIEFEPGLARDLPETLDRLIPPSRDYGHEQAWHDDNGHSHLQATLLGPLPERAVRRRRTPARYLAADRASGMRCPRPAAHHRDNRCG